MKLSILFALLFLPLLSFGQFGFPAAPAAPPKQTYKIEHWRVQRFVKAGYPEFWEQKWYSDTISGERLIFSFSKDYQEVNVYDGLKLVANIYNRFDIHFSNEEDPREVFKNKRPKIKITRL
jgi:hypothetical protein